MVTLLTPTEDRPKKTAALAAPTIAESAAAIARLEATLRQILHGKDEAIRLAVVALLAGGHVLIEDVPGVGKTTLAHALARALGLSFQRLQFTSDLLPSDIIGVSLFKQAEQRFDFVPGPLFTNVLLADEINRATPKTQSALLEAMSERKVSIDRKRYTLPSPFLVIATQNPFEHRGTFPLPESQLDRFLMSLAMGYPPRSEEKRLLLSGGIEKRLEDLPAALRPEQLLDLQAMAQSVKVNEKLVDYLLELVDSTRSSGEFALPVSTRGAQSLYRAVQALALAEGRDFAIPDDVQRLAVPVLGHRVTLHRGNGSLEETRRAIAQVVAKTPVPL
jgi:MoxR-like ATPase